MTTKAFLLSVIFLTLSGVAAHGQVAVTICIEKALADQKEGVAKGIASTDAEATIADIAGSIGLNRSPRAVACDLDLKAEAIYAAEGQFEGIREGEYIVYNNDWFEGIGGKDITTPGLVILAHELAHFLNDHFTARRNIPRLQQEEEADAFTGCAIARMGRSYGELRDTLERLRSATSDGRYPSESRSIELAKDRYLKCGGTIDDKKPHQSDEDVSPPKLPNVFWKGPDLTERAENLKGTWPSGNWRRVGFVLATKEPIYRFDYSTEYLGKNWTAAYSSKDSRFQLGPLKRASLWTAISDIEDQSKLNPASSFKDPAYELCVTYYEKVLSNLKIKFGPVRDKPKITDKLDHSYIFHAPACRKSKCTVSADIRREQIFFGQTNDVRLQKIFIDATETGVDRKKYSVRSCDITVDIGDISEVISVEPRDTLQ